METWLYDELNNSQLNWMGYDIYRTNRTITGNFRGGGMIVAVRKSYKSKFLCSNNAIENLFISVQFNSDSYVIGSVYIAPNAGIEIYKEHCQILENLFGKYQSSKYIICGDFNCSSINWSSSFAQVGMDSKADILINTYSFLNLSQINYIPNSRNTFLDLVFTNINDIKVSKATDQLSNESIHHYAYTVDFNLVTSNNLQYSDICFDFNGADYESLNYFYNSYEWDTILSSNHIDIDTDCFYKIIFEGMHRFIPYKYVINNSPKFPAWFNKKLKKLISNKIKAHKKFRDSGCLVDYIEFSELRRKCKVLNKNLYVSFMSKINSKILADTKQFWQYARSVKNENSFPNRLSYQSQVVEGGQEIVDMFANFFATVYSNISLTAEQPIIDIGDNTNSLNVTREEVFSALDGLKITNTCGPDGLSSFFLAKCKYSLSTPIHYLFAKSLSHCVVPNIWKLSYITPIFKSGDKHNIENYRSISIQSVIPKILDKLVSQQLHNRYSHLLSDNQHGFRKNKSTITNLFDYTHYIAESLIHNKQVDSIYIDFRKAFDTVNISILIDKLLHIGINRKSIAWINSFLYKRKQQVKIKNHVSHYINACSGVPQGSHCGPILFLFFIDDICKSLSNSRILLFADDLKIFRAVSSSKDSELLQLDLNSVTNWCKVNQLYVNFSKCNSISFGRNRSKIDYQYQLSGHILDNVTTIKDLGIIFDVSLNFNAHIDYVCQKALKQWGFVWRIGKELSVECLKLLYIYHI